MIETSLVAVIHKYLYLPRWKNNLLPKKKEKKIDSIMETEFSRGDVRILMRQTIEKYQEWLDFGLDGYELKKET
jgi:hypothetical protein